MTDPSRRTLLTALAASAVAVPVAGLSGAPARAAGTARAAAAVEPFPLPGDMSSPRSCVTMPDLNASYFTRLTLADPLTTAVLPGTPARTEVTSAGRRVALLTHGARTVVVAGPRRTFTENKKPFSDDFLRDLPAGSWGASPGGGEWTTAGPAAGDYLVEPGRGLINLSTDYASRHASLRDGEIRDADVRCTACFAKSPTGEASSFALSFGYQDTHNNYRARLSFLTSGAVQFRLEKEVADTVTQLGTALTPAVSTAPGAQWTIRVRREGPRIRAKAWPTASAEPDAWAFDTTDTTFTKGRVGIRALANQGATNLPMPLVVSNFRVDEANWQSVPSVTHSDWVRVLPEPFDGVWTDATERTVRYWAGSTDPDVLAHAAMFLAGAPAVTAGAGAAQGRPVMGEAGYGYLDAQGNRLEGADFHEYMAIGWTFDEGGYTGPSSRQAGNLDCSGYTRMVYGYHLGVPLAAGESTSGTHLPRRSRDMAEHSPGVRVDRTDGTNPPAAQQLQPGDLVLFNADSGDDTAGPTVDHVGIHLGTDTDGRRRFLSSRKSVNGPTMADLSGASVLDGTGVYARTLHTVHRI
ncbi:NlpC/P60 family protein [Streptomyces sp. NPDC058637]|uniref:NlpC/P60 family protein n=1 Tax=Streptomyces sp. NPDC058637 TaxID=3346569 RepID=UPI0036473E92